MPTIFVSHNSRPELTAKAVEFKSILLRGESDLQIFLSSDWESIHSGTIWLQEVEQALATHTHFIALIMEADDAQLPWICYEVGFSRGRGLLPKIFVFGEVEAKDIVMPIGGIEFVGTWDTNRWKMELLAMGVKGIDEKERDLAKLFKQ